MEKRLLDEKEESPAKKLKMETKATEEESDNGKALISLEEKVKVKKAQNVQEKLAEMKNAYLEDLEDEMAEDVEEDELDGEDDVLIESETLSEEAKMMNEDEGGYGTINEKQASSTETECQVCFIPFLICSLNFLSFRFASWRSGLVLCRCTCKCVTRRRSRWILFI